MAEAGAIAVTIARDAQALDETRREFEAAGLRLITHAVDIADPQQCAAFVKFMTEEHGGVDILVNNAGRSIRRGIENSFDRFHDYERTMEVNYFEMCIRDSLRVVIKRSTSFLLALGSECSDNI